jgi:DNA-binding MarR family transcriptional regulator
MLNGMGSPGDVPAVEPAGENRTASRDMLSLALAGMPELIAALEEERTLAEEPSALPPRSKRVARMIMAETIRLIRLGTRVELATAALEVAKALARPYAERLATNHPSAYRLLCSASDALGAATPPSSAGSELTVLRSWNDNARKALAIVNKAPGRVIARADLRAQLGVDESYLSHLLADLEAPGLVVRIRFGRTVQVHLGPVGRSEHVQQILSHEPPPPNTRMRTRLEQGPRLTNLDLSELVYARDNEPAPPSDAEEIVHAFNTEKHIDTFDNVAKDVGGRVSIASHIDTAWRPDTTAVVLERLALRGPIRRKAPLSNV